MAGGLVKIQKSFGEGLFPYDPFDPQSGIRFNEVDSMRLVDRSPEAADALVMKWLECDVVEPGNQALCIVYGLPRPKTLGAEVHDSI